VRLRRARRIHKERELANGDLSWGLITAENPTSTASEAYRAMRTALFYAMADPPPKVIMLTSPRPKEGKSITCANLGVVLAQAGKSTLVMDCDLRKPVLHEVFGVRNSRGIVDVLVGKEDLREVLQEPLPNLNVVSAGPIPYNPTELLSSRSFAEVVDQARQDFDYVLMDSSHVLIDSSPVGSFPDPVVIAAQVDGVLLVLDIRSARKEALRQAMRALESVGANVLGTVLNNAEYAGLA
jgi:capsular exopolysaccharide synthesis family protein